MLRIIKVIANDKQKYALLRVSGEVNEQLGVYASHSYAVKKAKSHMSQTQEWLECEIKGIFNVWKLQDDELVSTENDQLQAIERVKDLLKEAEQESDFRVSAESEITSNSTSTSTEQTNSSEQIRLNAVLNALGESLYLIHKSNSIMDFINGAKRIDVVRDEVWGYEPESWAKGSPANQRNALCACAVVGLPRSPP